MSEVSDRTDSRASSHTVQYSSVSPGLAGQSSLRAAIAAFEEYMQDQGFAENTIKAFLSDLRILTEFIGAGTPVDSISTRDLNSYAAWLVSGRGVPCSPKSLARRVTSLKVLFGWLADTNVLRTDAAAAVVHQPATSPLPVILSELEVERVLDVTQRRLRAQKPDARPHLLVTLLLHTGIKKGECMNIVMNHFDFSDALRPAVWIRYANPQRRHKERKLRLPVSWPATLVEYRAQYEPQMQVFPWTPRNLEYVLADVAGQANLPRGLSFEMLRWTCAVRDYREGMQERELRQKLGISKITWREVGVKIARLALQRPGSSPY